MRSHAFWVYRLKAFSPTCEKAFVAIVSVFNTSSYPESRALLNIAEDWRILIQKSGCRALQAMLSCTVLTMNSASWGSVMSPNLLGIIP